MDSGIIYLTSDPLYLDPAETGLEDQITVLKARPGHQITALNINQGRLIDIVQVKVMRASRSSPSFSRTPRFPTQLTQSPHATAQHPVPNPVDATTIPWYVVANYNSKSDDYDLTEEEKDALGLLSGCHFANFQSYSKAKKAYNSLTVQRRKGNTVLLLDCKKMKTVKYTGKPMDIIHVEQEVSWRRRIELGRKSAPRR